MSNLDYAAKQLNKIRNRIKDATKAVGRDESEVELIGASKMQNHQLVRDFVTGGLGAIGENYLQEAIDKRQHLQDLTLDWHFIGHIQSNKTKLIAENFDWVHGVDRLKVARRIAEQNPRPEPINLLMQINLDNEASKSGASVTQAPQLCDQISQLENVQLRGFMVIPKPRESSAEQAAAFAKAYQLLAQTNQKYGLTMDNLSMGMSNDLEAAIAQGSTMIRIGTDLFGARPA